MKGKIEKVLKSNIRDVEVHDSTGIRFSMKPQDYPYDMQRVIHEYLEGIDTEIREMITELRENGKIEFKRYTIGKRSKKNVSDLKALIGKDFSGYNHAINTDAIRHIEIRHGVNGEADQSLTNADDFSRLSYIVQHYDSVDFLKDKNGNIIYSDAYRDENNNPSPMLLYKKEINGTYYFVEAVGENAYKKFWTVSAYINKKELTHVSASDNVSRQLTSETLHASRSSKDSIPEKSENVNRKSEKILNVPKPRTPDGMLIVF